MDIIHKYFCLLRPLSIKPEHAPPTHAFTKPVSRCEQRNTPYPQTNQSATNDRHQHITNVIHSIRLDPTTTWPMRLKQSAPSGPSELSYGAKPDIQKYSKKKNRNSKYKKKTVHFWAVRTRRHDIYIHAWGRAGPTQL